MTNKKFMKKKILIEAFTKIHVVYRLVFTFQSAIIRLVTFFDYYRKGKIATQSVHQPICKNQLYLMTISMTKRLYNHRSNNASLPKYGVLKFLILF